MSTYKIAASYNNYDGNNGVYVSSDSGSLWNRSNYANVEPITITSNSSGSLIAMTTYNGGVYGVYKSTDGGASFTIAGGSDYYNKIVSSGDGSFLVTSDMVYTKIYTSTNQGSTWNVTSDPPAGGISGIAMSKTASGSGYSIVVADPTGYIFISTDSGSNWTYNSIPGVQSKKFASVCCSSDGTKIYACSDESNGAIYYSTNGGSNWSLTNVGNYGIYTSITCSNDGNSIYCCLKNSGIWYSVNGGINWTFRSLPYFFNTISCSGDGSFAAAVGENINIYTSNNSGSTWTQQTGSDNTYKWNSVTVIADPVCVTGDTEILMADGTFKMIKDIQRGDFVMTDKKTGTSKKVCRVVNSVYGGNVVRIYKGLLGNHKPIILTGGHPIWVNKDQNRVCARDIVKRQWVHVCELFYNIQFEEEGTYYANGVKMDSLSPNNHERKLPKELYFDSSKYDEALIIKTEDDPRRLKPKMIDRYVSMKTKSL
jgi:photosystem II stability/assembly factor-like uncharacterized protein